MFHWDNTLVMVFSSEYEQFNHIEYQTLQGNKTAYFFDQQIIDYFIQLKYPTLTQEIVNKSTFEALIQIEHSTGMTALKQLLND